jgi:chorismate mutase/prephenate dehydrogenase
MQTLPPTDPSLLDSLRAELDRIDATILAAAARRAEIVAEVAEFKRREGRPIFDRARERRMQERIVGLAATLGLDGHTAEALSGVLIDASHRIQEHVLADAGGGDGERKQITIIGGRGQMGALLGRWLAGRGHTITALDVDDDLDTAESITTADIVVISVPMAHAAQIARQVGPRVRPGALLCDVNSLKTEVCAAMEASTTGEVLGLHPMFGPSVGALRRQKVVVCPVRPGPMGAWLSAELGRMGAELIESDPSTHDMMMAVIQVLVHFSTIARGDALRRVGVPIEQSLRFTSPIYRLELAFIGRLFAQSPDLYAEITMTNPHSERVRAAFRDAVLALDGTVASGDRDAFRAAFKDTSTFFADFGKDAMRLSDLVIETLVRQA